MFNDFASKKSLAIFSVLFSMIAIGLIIFTTAMNLGTKHEKEKTMQETIYQEVKDSGYTGTYEEWIQVISSNSIGGNGKSAYELAQDLGYQGTLQEWLDSLKGTNGKDGITTIDELLTVLTENGFTGNEEQLLSILNGENGLSAYEIALKNGYEGTEAEWLLSLVGAKGQDGKDVAFQIGNDGGTPYIQWKYATDEEWNNLVSLSDIAGEDALLQVANGAIQFKKENDTEWKDLVTFETLVSYLENYITSYDLAKINGYQGSEEEWYASLVGANGKDGITPVIGDNGNWWIDGKDTGISATTPFPEGTTLYEYAQELGYTGSLEELLAELAKNTIKENPVVYIGEDGYWYINNEKTEYIAIPADVINNVITYETAVEGGFDGTYEEWLKTVIGANGKDGITPVIGNNGNWWIDGKDTGIAATSGDNGDSAYEAAVEAGFEGTYEEWLKSLFENLVPGNSTPYIGENGNWYISGIDTEISAVNGRAGESAYEIAVRNGFKGSEAEWLVSLIGKDGKSVEMQVTDGVIQYKLEGEDTWTNLTTYDELVSRLEEYLTSYDLAKINGFKGSEEEWYASLVGANGKDGVTPVIGDNGNWWIDGKDTGIAATGEAGKTLYEIVKESGYTGTLEEYLAELAKNKVEENPVVYIGEDGYWYIDGTKTEYLAVSPSIINNTYNSYTEAVEGGFDGTYEEWLQTVVGANGKDGVTPVIGDNGNWWIDGKDTGIAATSGNVGDSAFDVAKENGFDGDIEDYIKSLVENAVPSTPYIGENNNWYIDGVDTGISAINGSAGESAYDIAVRNGFVGTEEEWLKSLIGKDGKSVEMQVKDGVIQYKLEGEDTWTNLTTYDELVSRLEEYLTSYDLAKINGFKGSEDEWYASLVGANGKDGVTPVIGDNGNWWIDGKDTGIAATSGNVGDSLYDVAQLEGYIGTLEELLAELAKNPVKENPTVYIGEDGYWYINNEKTEYIAVPGDVINNTITYETAVEGGFEGTYEEWLKTIIGTDGKDGKTPYIGENGNWYIDGVDTGISATSGENGESAYDIAKENGFEGTYEEWLKSLFENLVSEYPSTPYIGENNNWYIDGVDTGISAINGSAGESAYDIAVRNGFTGTETEWLASLVGANGKTPYIGENGNWFIGETDTNVKAKGEKGDTGLSAYEVAKANGFKGTETEWLASLVGAKGQDGNDGKTPYIGENGNWFIGETDTNVKASATAKEVVIGIVEGAIKWHYTGSDEWTNIVSLDDLAGKDGKTPEFTILNNYIVYKYTDEDATAWRNLIDLTTLAGSVGTDGKDGKKIELGVSNTHIQYRYEGDTEWVDLVELASITGKDGCTWTTGDGEPTAPASEGDLYLDLLTSDVYKFVEEEWTLIGNIKGISVSKITVDSLYDEKTEHFFRYTFTMTDGEKKIIDVYDPKHVIEIERKEYRFYQLFDPKGCPDITLNIRYSTGARDTVKMNINMVKNFSEVHFTNPGTYEVLIYYYGCYGYIDCIVYGDSPLPIKGTYLTRNNFVIVGDVLPNSFLDTYLHVEFDDPRVSSREVPLSECNLIPISNNFTYQEYDVEYLGYRERIKVYNIPEENISELQKAKVKELRYLGETIYYTDTLSSHSTYGNLEFTLELPGFTGTLIRPYDVFNDKISLVNKTTEYNSELISDLITEAGKDDFSCEIIAAIWTTGDLDLVQVKSSNVVGITFLSSEVDVHAVKATLSHEILHVGSSFPDDLYITYETNTIPKYIRTKVNSNMIVGDIDFNSIGEKHFTVRYEYSGYVLEKEVSIYLFDASNYKNWYKFNESDVVGNIKGEIDFELLTTTAKSGADAETIPPVYVRFTYSIAGYYDDKGDLFNIPHWHSKENIIYEEEVRVTQEMLVSPEIYDFTKSGLKTIIFNYDGSQFTVSVLFYDVFACTVESLTGVTSYDRSMCTSDSGDGEPYQVEFGENIQEYLRNYYYGKTIHVKYFESINKVLEEDIILNNELIDKYFDCSKFIYNKSGFQVVRFVFKEHGDTEGFIVPLYIYVKDDPSRFDDYTFAGTTFGDSPDVVSLKYLYDSDTIILPTDSIGYGFDIVGYQEKTYYDKNTSSYKTANMVEVKDYSKLICSGTSLCFYVENVSITNSYLSGSFEVNDHDTINFMGYDTQIPSSNHYSMSRGGYSFSLDGNTLTITATNTGDSGTLPFNVYFNKTNIFYSFDGGNTIYIGNDLYENYFGFNNGDLYYRGANIDQKYTLNKCAEINVYDYLNISFHDNRIYVNDLPTQYDMTKFLKICVDKSYSNNYRVLGHSFEKASDEEVVVTIDEETLKVTANGHDLGLLTDYIKFESNSDGFYLSITNSYGNQTSGDDNLIEIGTGYSEYIVSKLNLEAMVNNSTEETYPSLFIYTDSDGYYNIFGKKTDIYFTGHVYISMEDGVMFLGNGSIADLIDAYDYAKVDDVVRLPFVVYKDLGDGQYAIHVQGIYDQIEKAYENLGKNISSLTAELQKAVEGESGLGTAIVLILVLITRISNYIESEGYFLVDTINHTIGFFPESPANYSTGSEGEDDPVSPVEIDYTISTDDVVDYLSENLPEDLKNQAVLGLLSEFENTKLSICGEKVILYSQQTGSETWKKEFETFYTRDGNVLIVGPIYENMSLYFILDDENHTASIMVGLYSENVERYSVDMSQFESENGIDIDTAFVLIDEETSYSNNVFVYSHYTYNSGTSENTLNFTGSLVYLDENTIMIVGNDSLNDLYFLIDRENKLLTGMYGSYYTNLVLYDVDYTECETFINENFSECDMKNEYLNIINMYKTCLSVYLGDNAIKVIINEDGETYDTGLEPSYRRIGNVIIIDELYEMSGLYYVITDEENHKAEARFGLIGENAKVYSLDIPGEFGITLNNNVVILDLTTSSFYNALAFIDYSNGSNHDTIEGLTHAYYTDNSKLVIEFSGFGGFYFTVDDLTNTLTPVQENGLVATYTLNKNDVKNILELENEATGASVDEAYAIIESNNPEYIKLVIRGNVIPYEVSKDTIEYQSGSLEKSYRYDVNGEFIVPYNESYDHGKDDDYYSVDNLGVIALKLNSDMTGTIVRGYGSTKINVTMSDELCIEAFGIEKSKLNVLGTFEYFNGYGFINATISMGSDTVTESIYGEVYIDGNNYILNEIYINMDTNVVSLYFLDGPVPFKEYKVTNTKDVAKFVDFIEGSMGSSVLSASAIFSNDEPDKVTIYVFGKVNSYYDETLNEDTWDYDFLVFSTEFALINDKYLVMVDGVCFTLTLNKENGTCYFEQGFGTEKHQTIIDDLLRKTITGDGGVTIESVFFEVYEQYLYLSLTVKQGYKTLTQSNIATYDVVYDKEFDGPIYVANVGGLTIYFGLPKGQSVYLAQLNLGDEIVKVLDISTSLGNMGTTSIGISETGKYAILMKNGSVIFSNSTTPSGKPSLESMLCSYNLIDNNLVQLNVASVGYLLQINSDGTTSLDLSIIKENDDYKVVENIHVPFNLTDTNGNKIESMTVHYNNKSGKAFMLTGGEGDGLRAAFIGEKTNDNTFVFNIATAILYIEFTQDSYVFNIINSIGNLNILG